MPTAPVKTRLAVLRHPHKMVLDVITAMRTRSVVLHGRHCNKSTKNLKVSPEGEGFIPIVETIIPNACFPEKNTYFREPTPCEGPSARFPDGPACCSAYFKASRMCLFGWSASSLLPSLAVVLMIPLTSGPAKANGQVSGDRYNRIIPPAADEPATVAPNPKANRQPPASPSVPGSGTEIPLNTGSGPKTD